MYICGKGTVLQSINVHFPFAFLNASLWPRGPQALGHGRVGVGVRLPDPAHHSVRPGRDEVALGPSLKGELGDGSSSSHFPLASPL